MIEQVDAMAVQDIASEEMNVFLSVLEKIGSNLKDFHPAVDKDIEKEIILNE